MSKKGILICSLDIETGGPRVTKNPLISIGYVFGTVYSEIIEKGRISFDFDITKFDDDTMKNFWNKKKKLLEMFKNEALPPKEAISKFIKKLDKYDEEYDIKIISDNPQFEIRFLDYYIELYTDRKPLEYRYNGEYCQRIFDIDSIHRGYELLKYEDGTVSNSYLITKYKFTIPIKYDHSPDNDAEYNFHLHTNMLRVKKTR